MTSGPMSDGLGTSSSDVTFVVNHAPKSLLGSDTAVESGLSAIPQSSTVPQLNPLSQYSTEGQYIDLDWLLTASRASKPVLERSQDPSSLMERDHKIPDHNQGSSDTSLPQHIGSPDHDQVSDNGGHLAHKTATAPIAMDNEHETPLKPDAIEMERLNRLVECSRRLGFNDLSDALLAYYTSDLGASAVLSHEQSLNRVKQLPKFLSKIREHSKQWPAWERANYVRETLASAEDVYTEECRLARMNLANQGIGLTQKELQVGQMSRITRALQHEVCSASLTITRSTYTNILYLHQIPNTWALVTSIILHTNIPGEPQPPQTILMVMMLLCCRSHDPMSTLGLCQDYLFQHCTTDKGSVTLRLTTGSTAGSYS